MDISVINSKDVEILSEHLGDDAYIVRIEYKSDLHAVEIFSDGEIYRAFAHSKRRALGNAIKAYVKYN